MKLIHCADIHLDSKLERHLSKERAARRNSEILDTFMRMVKYADTNGIKHILISGDLFDVNRVSKTTANNVSAILSDYPGISFYYIRGNHDTEGFINDPEKMPKNLFGFSSEWKSYEIAENGTNVVITGIEISKENNSGIYKSLLLDGRNVNIVMLHGQETEGSKKDGEVINLPELRNKQIDYLALGHIHFYKKEKLDARAVYCYPGCLEGRGFDEAGEHGFVVLDVDTYNRTVSSEFVPFAKRKVELVEADISECMNTADILAVVSEALKKANVSDSSMVRVILTGATDVECVKDTTFIENRFADDYFVFNVKDESKIRIDYTKALSEKSLKGEFIRLIKADNTLSEDDKAEIIMYGIKALGKEKLD